MSNTLILPKFFRKSIFNLNNPIIQKGIVLSFSLFLILHSTLAQESIVKINLKRTKSSKIKVSYIPGPSDDNKIRFPNFDPQSYFYNKPSDVIKNLKAFGQNREALKITKDNETYSTSIKAKIWEYELHTSRYPNHFQVVLQSSFKKNKYYYLNPSLFSPISEDKKHLLLIRNHLKGGKIDSLHIMKGESYIYGFAKEFDSVEINGQWHRIYYHGSFLARKGIKSSIPIIVSAFTKSTNYYIPEDFEFHIVQKNGNTADVLSPSAAFNNGIAVSFENSNDLKQTENFIINTMWALFKTISPNKIKDDRLSTLIDNQKHSIHQWYYESLTEYLALNCLIQNELITESFFTEIMQTKTVNSIKNRPFSLIQLGKDMSNQRKNIEIKNNLKAYDIYTNRGVLAAFFMDILLNTESNGQFGLLDKFMAISLKYKNYPFPHDSFLHEFSAGESMGFKTIIEHYIIGIDELEYKNYYDLIDWQFFRKGEVHKTFIKGGNFTYFPIIEHYVCTKKGKNTVGLEKGDIILSINGNEKLSQIKLDEVIVPNRQFRKENRVKLHILRNGEEMVLRGKSDFSKKINHDVIIPNFNPLSPGYKTRQFILQ